MGYGVSGVPENWLVEDPGGPEEKRQWVVQRIWWGCAGGGLGSWVWRVDEGLGGTEEEPSSLPLEFYTTERDRAKETPLAPGGLWVRLRKKIFLLLFWVVD